MSDVKNGLYSIRIMMEDGSNAHASGIIVLHDGRVLGGDSHFYYFGAYTFNDGKWRGELTTGQHADAVGVNFLFGGREVTCGFTGTYTEGSATVDGTALVGKKSVPFRARLDLKAARLAEHRSGCLLDDTETPSFASPRATISSASSANGRCSAFRRTRPAAGRRSARTKRRPFSSSQNLFPERIRRSC
nr:GrlR family regulatory protein [Bradyrhizobium tropiciagri]